jgi:hypothetical protein
LSCWRADFSLLASLSVSRVRGDGRHHWRAAWRERDRGLLVRAIRTVEMEMGLQVPGQP